MTAKLIHKLNNADFTKEENNRLIHKLVSEHGTVNMFERWEAGRLPKREIKELARRVLFPEIQEQTIAEPMSLCTDHAKRIVIEAYDGALTATQWETFKKVRDLIQYAEVDIVARYWLCSESVVYGVSPHGRSPHQHVARLSWKWAGYDFHELFDLGQ